MPLQGAFGTSNPAKKLLSSLEFTNFWVLVDSGNDSRVPSRSLSADEDVLGEMLLTLVRSHLEMCPVEALDINGMQMIVQIS